MDLFQDWNLIVAAIKQTYGDIDILQIRARDFLSIYLPNLHKDTNMMQLIRIRQTPSSKLSIEERKVKLANRLPQSHLHCESFVSAIKALKAGEK